MNWLTKAVTTIAANLRLTDRQMVGWMIGGETDASERITVDSAMQLDVVWACVRLIAETVATLPLNFYRTGVDGIGRIDRTHPLYFILHDSPNADMTAVNFWEAMVGCYLLWGNSYALVSRGALSRVTALTPMRPDRIAVLRDNATGAITYRYSAFGQVEVFAEEDVFHIRGFTLDGLTGMSPVAQGRQTMGTARAAQRASGSFFRNGMRPSGVLIAPGYLNEKQRAETEPLIAKFSGASNTGTVPLLEGGWDFKNLSIAPDEAQFIETQALHVEQICRWFGVPPILIGHSKDTTAWGSGIEQIVIGWLTTGLRAHLRRVEQAISGSLLSPVERAERYYGAFDINELLRADSKSMAMLQQAQVNNGLRTRNEVRAGDNMPPMPGGDQLTVNSALVPAEMLGEIAKLPRDKIVAPGADIGGVGEPEEPTPSPGKGPKP